MVSSPDYTDSSGPLDSMSLASFSDTTLGTEDDSSLSSMHQPFVVEDVGILVRMIPSGNDCPPVIYKHDGRRFKHLKTAGSTIKLREGMEYGITISISPELTLRSQTMVLTTHDQVKGDEVVFLKENLTLVPCLRGYYCRWICELPTSEIGERRKLSATLDVEGFGTVSFPLMVKVYSIEDRNGSMNGYPMLSVSYRFGMDQIKNSSIMKSIDYFNAPWRV